MAVTPEQAKALALAAARKRQAEAASVAEKPGGIGRTEAALRSFLQGLSLGAGDELAAGAAFAEERDAPLAKQTLDPGIYQRQLDFERKKLSEGRAQYPIATTAAELGGAVATPFIGPPVRTLGGAIAQGTALGGVYGFNSADKNRLTAAAKGALVGGVTSGVVGGIAKAIPKKAPQPKAPSIENLKIAKNIAYKAAERGDDIIPVSGLKGLQGKVQGLLAEEGYRPGLHPATKEALDAIAEDAGRTDVAGHTLKGIEGLRQQLLQAEMSAGKANDARLASKVLDEFDDFMDATAPAASAQYKTARELFSRMRKAQEIEALFEKAKNAAGGYTQSGFENTLRIQFRQLADNPRRFNRFNAEEKAAILKVVRGGSLQGVLRFFGKFAPRGPVSAMATGMLGNLAGGPLGAVAIGTAGEVSKAASNASRLGAAQQVSELVRRGPNALAVPMGLAQAPRQLGYAPAAVNALSANVEAQNALRKKNALKR